MKERTIRDMDDETLRAIEAHFHEVIRERAGHLLDQSSLGLPRLIGLPTSGEEGWFAVPGMYGGGQLQV